MILGLLFEAIGLFLILPVNLEFLLHFFSKILGRPSNLTWSIYFQTLGQIFIICGLFIFLIEVLIHYQKQLKNYLLVAGGWGENLSAKYFNSEITQDSGDSLDFNRIDWFAILFFVITALFFQLQNISNGFPGVILGGDAANIASFAAARAYPDLFLKDAILGNLNNIGLYTTIHLPLTIFLEKLLGNFGLAYSVLLFPHVFLQFFAYYLLGRVLFHNRYWAILFSLSIASQISLAGGEMWGAVTDAMPRFTYQVLLPFLLILILTKWRTKPSRWSWVMVIVGLGAFIHPVSTPAWAFALWIGFWPIMPADYSMPQKVKELFKLGMVLAAALLPYVIIYFSFHKSGGNNKDYDLVYSILTHFFPSNLLNIPAAVGELIKSTSQFGLLWFGLIGFFLTIFLFRDHWSRVKQMLTWMLGIIIISILIPLVEQFIERSLRIIPLQTELMRGMRYLVPFLFIFWFYPLAEISRRSSRRWMKTAIVLIGTGMTAAWLIFNPPLPFINNQKVLNCFEQAKIICPTDQYYANALTYIKNKTPEQSKFVVFLTNRWSGIEVRYLGLRPMVYAYKDRGQLAFTNFDALKTWYYFEQRESAIFSRNASPTIDIKRKKMIDFAKDAQANYLLTNFPFPKEVEKDLKIHVIYRNKSYSIIQIYKFK